MQEEMKQEEMRFVYSKNIFKFMQTIQGEIRAILSKEIGLKVVKDRFFNVSKSASYPIKVRIFNHRRKLGFFDPDFLELGFHECLMRSSNEQLKNIIRHEIAHYIAYINHGKYVLPHGAEFLALCERLGWGKEVSAATMALDDIQEEILQESGVLRKIQKLMSLAASNNPHEAELAMVKSQQLLLKHNIDEKYVGNDDDEKMILKRIMKQKKDNAKMQSIANILQTFFVSTVYTRADDYIYLEILGTSLNVEIAEYVAAVLDQEFDRMWDFARTNEIPLKGQVAKNSFFRGVARGYCDKIQALKRDYDPLNSNALIVLEKKLQEAVDMAYSRLTSRNRQVRYCSTSSALGERMGRSLNINPALNEKAKNQQLLLS